MGNLKPGEQVTKIFIQSAKGREWGGGGGSSNGGSEEILHASTSYRSRTYGLLATSLDQGKTTTISSLFILWEHFLGYQE